jgi:hypothetical protein
MDRPDAHHYDRPQRGHKVVGKDWTHYAALISFYGVIHFVANLYFEKTESGRGFAKFLQTWKTDSLLHLVLCALTVLTFGVAAILALGLALRGC